MTVIVVSGSVAVGKEKLAKYLAKKLKYFRLDLSKYYKDISVGYNSIKKCYDVDLRKFEKLIKEKVKENDKIIVDSHIAHLLPKKMVDLCIILTCSNLKKLQKNLERKKYSKKKVRENLDTEIFQVCLVEARKRNHNLLVFDEKISNNKILSIVKAKLE
tara:strand:- start:430 stop:906 length:477 start_codon:yes stop_codon:yes gene_type:complete